MSETKNEARPGFSSPRTLMVVAAAIILAAAGSFGGWWLMVKPKRDLVRLRYDAMGDMLKLYGLQVQYKAARGRYANDLDTLLTILPERREFKARLASHVDLNTVAVVDAGAKFKIEVNVLDGDRTLMKIKGPISSPAR